MKHEPKTSIEKIQALETRLFGKIDELHEAERKGAEPRVRIKLQQEINSMQVQYACACV